MGLKIEMGPLQGAKELADYLRNYKPRLDRRVQQTMRRIVTRVELGAKRRTPVDTGLNRNSILTDVYADAQGTLYGEVGTNTEYGKYIEFGTDRIAGGAVKQIGMRPDVTDDMAVHWWPAKAADIGKKNQKTSVVRKGGKLLNQYGGELANQNPQEQMPWLRPAFMAEMGWIIDELNRLLDEP